MTLGEAKKILGITSLLEVGDEAQLKKLYRKLARERHPDELAKHIVTLSKYDFKETSLAYDFLSRDWENLYSTEKRDEEERKRREHIERNVYDQMSSSGLSYSDWVSKYPWVGSELKDYMTDEQWEAWEQQNRDYNKTATQEEIDRMCMESIQHKKQQQEYEETLKRMNSLTFTVEQLRTWERGQLGWSPFGRNFNNDKLQLTISVKVHRDGQEIFSKNLNDVVIPLCTETIINVTGLLALKDEISIEIMDTFKTKLTLSMASFYVQTSLALGPVKKSLKFFLRIDGKSKGIEVTI